MLREFAEHLLADGKSPKTVESYVGDVAGFMEYLKSMDVEGETELRRYYVTSFRNSLVQSGFKPATVNKKVNSLTMFNRFLVEQGVLAEQVVQPRKDRVRIASGSEKEVDVFSDQEVERIVFFAQNRKRVSLRNRLIVCLLLYTGARVSEVCNVKLGDVDYLTGHLRIVGKGGKVREVPLREEVLELVREYVRTERRASAFADSDRLLVSQRAPKLHRDAVNRLLCGWSGEGGLGFRLNPHKFRHTFCSRLLKRGVPLTTVSKLAGHSSVQTTAAYYISTSRQDKIAAVNLL